MKEKFVKIISEAKDKEYKGFRIMKDDDGKGWSAIVYKDEPHRPQAIGSTVKAVQKKIDTFLRLGWF